MEIYHGNDNSANEKSKKWNIASIRACFPTDFPMQGCRIPFLRQFESKRIQPYPSRESAPAENEEKAKRTLPGGRVIPGNGMTEMKKTGLVIPAAPVFTDYFQSGTGIFLFCGYIMR